METKKKESFLYKRKKTDTSLNDERRETDSQESHKEIEEESDAKIDLNRVNEDKKRELEREVKSPTLDNQNVIDERKSSDKARDIAREKVDLVIKEERLEKDLISKPLQDEARKATDSNLTIERDFTDSSSKQDKMFLRNEKSSHDLTKQALADRDKYLALAKAAEAKYRGLLESAHDAIIAVGVTGTIELANEQATEWFGYTREELIGQPIEMLVPERFRVAHVQQRDGYLAHPIKRPMGRGLDLYGRRKDGSEFSVDIALSPSGNPDEKLVIAVIRDVTEKRKNNMQLRFLAMASRLLAESLDRENTLKKMAELVAAEVAEGCVIRLLGHDGKLHVETVAYHDPEKQRTLESLVNSLEARGIVPIDFSEVLKTQAVRINKKIDMHLETSENPDLRRLGKFTTTLIPLRAYGRMLGVVSFLLDESSPQFAESDIPFLESVGARIAISIENAHLYQDAQRATKVREQILAIVSHDLRNPLMVIQSIGQFLPKIKAGDPSKLSAYSEKIHKASDLMLRMIGDLMDFSKIQEGKLSIKKQAVKPNAMIKTVLEMMNLQAEQKGLELSSEVNPELPEIQCDEQRIGQALSNLVGNAIKFTEKGGRVHITAVESPGGVKFSISDSGAGISPENLTKVFDRYWQADRNTTFSAGLGLAITKGIIEAHGGKIWPESKLGQGSTFIINLPTGTALNP